MVVGLVCRLPKKGTPAVILAGDRQFVSSGAESSHKIAILPNSSVLVAGLGSSILTDRTVDTLKGLLAKQSASGDAPLSCEKFEALMHETAGPAMKRIVLDHEEEVRASGFGLLLACSDKENVCLYAVQSDGLPFRVDHGPGYGCFGRGYQATGALRFNQFRTECLPPKRAGRLAAFTILALSMVDTTVSRVPEIFETVEGRAKMWDEDALRLARERAASWDESLNRFWGWLSQRDADLGLAAVEYFMNKRPAGALSEVPPNMEETNSNSEYLLQPT